MSVPFDFNSADRIIRFGMFHAGYLQKGDLPNSDDYAQYMPTLSDIFNMAQTQGLKLWLNSDLAIPLTSGKSTYTLGLGGDVNIPKPLRAISGYYLDTNNNKTPFNPAAGLSRDEYTRLSNVTTLGSINSYFADKQQNFLVISFWNNPSVSAALGVAHLIVQNQINNPIQLTDQLNFPQEWYLYLIWAFADEICTGQPQAIMDRCSQRAGMYKEQLEDWDVEDAATMMTPDTRMVYNTGVFGR
jgi:hypothetical protein